MPFLVAMVRERCPKEVFLDHMIHTSDQGHRPRDFLEVLRLAAAQQPPECVKVERSIRIGDSRGRLQPAKPKPPLRPLRPRRLHQDDLGAASCCP